LLHISEIAHYRVGNVRDEIQEGDQVLVKVINVDPTGKVRLSRKALLPTPTSEDDKNKQVTNEEKQSSTAKPSGDTRRSHSSGQRGNRTPPKR
jgi:predicted RNA-binding protein with RPS1 domain